MVKYYTRACNFFYGPQANLLIRKKKALPLCGNKNIAFNNIEIFSRNGKKIKNKLINIKDLKKLNFEQKNKIRNDLKKISSKRKNFLKHVNFSSPSIMGILNLTPDSFSDGGKFNKYSNSLKRINNLIKFGADIIDIGGESTRPGSKEVNPKKEFKRLEKVLKVFKKKK
tara:strand:+ start:262 stop:768 length:507 start_codon:yes stop_codon:yes gene_type:complete